jgi:putative addiction module component (TIGR02574 family)
MDRNATDVLEAALALPEADRVRLVEELLATLPRENEELTDDELEVELERRYAEYQRDPSVAIPWSAIKRQE